MGLGGREGEQGLPGLKGRAVQPQATYIRQPEARVSHDPIQCVSCRLLLIDAGVSHRLDGHKDDVCPLRESEVFCKFLWEEGRERRHVTLRALMVLLSWAVHAALASDARQCWQQWLQASWQQWLQSVHGGGREERALRVREEGWAPGQSVLALQRSRACRWPGGLELLVGHWSAALAWSLLGASRNPLTRDSEAPPAPPILDAFAHPSALLMPRARGPARGKLITMFLALVK